MPIIGITKLVCDYTDKNGKPCGKMFMVAENGKLPPGSEKVLRLIDMSGTPRAFCDWPHLLQFGVDFIKATPKVPQVPAKIETKPPKISDAQMKKLEKMGVIEKESRAGAAVEELETLPTTVPPRPEDLTLEEEESPI